MPKSALSCATNVRLFRTGRRGWQARKGAFQRLADRIAKPLVPGIVIAAALIAVVGGLLDDPVTWIECALVAASPCAPAISVPVAAVTLRRNPDN